jgi:hypothetical protein
MMTQYATNWITLQAARLSLVIRHISNTGARVMNVKNTVATVHAAGKVFPQEAGIQEITGI